MGDMEGAFDKFRASPAYGPVGVLVAATVWKSLKVAMDKAKLPDCGELANCLLALMLSGVYMSTWMTEGNPHDAHVTENQLGEEIPLLVIAGYYAASCFPVDSAASLLYRLLSVVICLLLIYSGSGANVANTFVFLVEAPAAFISTRILMAKRSPPRENNAACSVVFFLTRVSSLTYLTVRILVQDQIPLYMKGAVLLLSILTLTFVPKLFESCCGEKPKASYTNPNGATRQQANTGGIKGKQK